MLKTVLTRCVLRTFTLTYNKTDLLQTLALANTKHVYNATFSEFQQCQATCSYLTHHRSFRMYVPAKEERSIRHDIPYNTHQHNNYSSDICLSNDVYNGNLLSINNINQLSFSFTVFTHVFDYIASSRHKNMTRRPNQNFIIASDTNSAQKHCCATFIILRCW